MTVAFSRSFLLTDKFRSTALCVVYIAWDCPLSSVILMHHILLCLSSFLKPPNNGAKCIPVRDKGFLVQVNTHCIHPAQSFFLLHNSQLIITNLLNRGCIIYITLPGPGSNELTLAKLSRQLIPGLFIAPGALS